MALVIVMQKGRWLWVKTLRYPFSRDYLFKRLRVTGGYRVLTHKPCLFFVFTSFYPFLTNVLQVFYPFFYHFFASFLPVFYSFFWAFCLVTPHQSSPLSPTCRGWSVTRWTSRTKIPPADRWGGTFETAGPFLVVLLTLLLMFFFWGGGGVRAVTGGMFCWLLAFI